MINLSGFSSEPSFYLKVKSESRTSEGLTVYVDPMAGYIYLKVVTGDSGLLALVIYDQQDKKVIEQSVPPNQLTSVPLVELPQGLYTVKVKVSTTELMDKFRF
ncbi:MAG: T9SS type A sorting domain-containing protein [Bacteroidota bacterium]